MLIFLKLCMCVSLYVMCVGLEGERKKKSGLSTTQVFMEGKKEPVFTTCAIIFSSSRNNHDPRGV